jgi:hypothetical protein
VNTIKLRGSDPGLADAADPHGFITLARAIARPGADSLSTMGNIGEERRRIEVLPLTAPDAPPRREPESPERPIRPDREAEPAR